MIPSKCIAIIEHALIKEFINKYGKLRGDIYLVGSAAMAYDLSVNQNYPTVPTPRDYDLLFTNSSDHTHFANFKNTFRPNGKLARYYEIYVTEPSPGEGGISASEDGMRAVKFKVTDLTGFTSDTFNLDFFYYKEGIANYLSTVPLAKDGIAMDIFTKLCFMTTDYVYSGTRNYLITSRSTRTFENHTERCKRKGIVHTL